MYELLSTSVFLGQGDIIDDCPLLTVNAAAAGIGGPPESTGYRVRVAVLTQACDLAQVKATRVLVAVVHVAAELVTAKLVKASIVRDHIRRHLVYGWYFLPAAPTPI